jgi:hypothetical protein
VRPRHFIIIERAARLGTSYPHGAVRLFRQCGLIAALDGTFGEFPVPVLAGDLDNRCAVHAARRQSTRVQEN